MSLAVLPFLQPFPSHSNHCNHLIVTHLKAGDTQQAVTLITGDTRLLISCLAQNVAEFKGFPPPWIYHQAFYMLYKCKVKPRLPSAKPSVCRWCGSLPASCGDAEERSWQQRADRCRDAQGVWVQRPAGLWQPCREILEICQIQALPLRGDRESKDSFSFIFFFSAALSFFPSALRYRRLCTSRNSISPVPFPIFLITFS